MSNEFNDKIAALEARMLVVENSLKDVKDYYAKLDGENSRQNEVLSKLNTNTELLIQSFNDYKSNNNEKKQDYKWVISFLFGGAIVPAILKMFGVI